MTIADDSDVLVRDAPAELVDATGSLHDPTDLRLKLAEHGYVLLRSLLPVSLLERVQRAVIDLLIEQGWVADDGLAPNVPVPLPGEDEYWRLYTDILRIEAMHRLAHDPVLVGLARALVDEQTVIVHPRKIPRIAVPHELAPQKTTPAHQDHPYTQGGVDGVTMWIPLTETPRGRGSLAVLEGSATAGIRPVRVGGEDYPCVPAELAAGDPDAVWATTDFAVGDVLVFHALTVHAALPNTTTAARISVDFRYRGISQPIGLTETWPPFHPFLGWWDDLTDRWESTEWIELPPGTRVMGVRPPQRGLDVPASRLVGSAPATLAPTARLS